ncbi:hypothetical protein [Kamptonema formosum]|uniref:hypothetical protein n=1 Tax=Kamptonema formosum TaxID=331992 RepID=UPI00037E083A|nr:hypothetical protein [Oscillatoria sp. PCC 10802]
MNQLELERESRKLTLAMRARNREIGSALIAHLRSQLTLEEVAGVTIVSIERLLFWSDTDSFFWSAQHIIPADVMQEVQKIISAAAYKRLISKGFVPGKDFSVDGEGKLLLNDRAKTAVLAR